MKKNKRKRSIQRASIDKKLNKNTVATNDGFRNIATRVGDGTPNLFNATTYPLTRKSWDFQTLNSMYRSHWVVRNIISAIPDDMLKNGYDIVSDITPDQRDKVEGCIRRTNLVERIREGLYWGRLYGGAIGVILIDGQEDSLEEPLDLDGVMPGSFKGLLIVDRWTGVNPGSELVTNINSPDFGLPKYYEIYLSDVETNVSMRIHHSRVIRFLGAKLPYMEMLAENYWGSSELEHVFDELNKRDNVSWNIACLTFMANIRVFKMEGMEQIFGLGGEKAVEELYRTVEGMNMLMNNNALQIIGEKDSYESHQFAFGGLGEIYDRFMMDVSGACGIPVTKLFGRSPAGMNATGESDMQNYYDLVEKEQETRLRPVLEKLLPIIFTSVLGAVPNDLDFNFNPVRRSNEAERQDLGSKQTTAVTQAFTAGLISQRTALKELQGSSKQTGMWTNITDNDIDNADDDITAVGESGLENLFGGGSQVTDADFKEEEHPRNKSGKFTSNGENASTTGRINDKILIETESVMRAHSLLNKGESLEYPKSVTVNPNVSLKVKEKLEKRGLTIADAQSYIDNALVRIKQSSDKYKYMAENGAAVLVEADGRLISVWSKNDFDEKHNQQMEVLRKWLK